MKPKGRSDGGLDELLHHGDWLIQGRDEANITASPGRSIREVPLKSGCGFAECLLYIDGAAAGIVEAEEEGGTLTGFGCHSFKYSEGLSDHLPVLRQPFAFCHESTSLETRFTNLFEHDVVSRRAFSFHRVLTQ